jgi:hypothetical protein
LAHKPYLLAPRFDPSQLDAVREFRANPIGHHSKTLEGILSILRSGPVAGKLCLICVKPHREWVIGRLSGIRNVAPMVTDNRVFHSIEAAEWEIFKLRWAAECGFPLDEEAL